MPTIAQVCAHWRSVEQSKYTPHSFRERAERIERFCQQFGQIAVENITPGEIILWINSQPGWKSPGTRRGCAQLLRHVFAVAARHRIASFNPFADLVRDFPDGEPRRAVTPQEFSRLLRNSDALFRRVLLFLWFTGSRCGEMAAVTWADVRLADRLIVLAKHKTSRKTRKPRIIYLDRRATALIQWLDRKPHDADDLVFANSDGLRWTCQSLATRMRVLRRRAQLPADCFLHGLRHAAAIRMVAAGVPIKIVAQALGHASVATTERFYVDLSNQGPAIHRALDAALGILPKASGPVK